MTPGEGQEEGVPPEDGRLRPLGRIVMNSSLLDGTLGLVVGAMATDRPVVAQALTAGATTSWLTTKAKVLGILVIYDEALRSDFVAVIDRASVAAERRNRLIHSLWGQDEDTGDYRRIRVTAHGKKGLRSEEPLMNPHEIDAVADALGGVVNELLAITDALQADGAASAAVLHPQQGPH